MRKLWMKKQLINLFASYCTQICPELKQSACIFIHVHNNRYACVHWMRWKVNEMCISWRGPGWKVDNSLSDTKYEFTKSANLQMWTILNHNSYLFFILAIQVLLIASWISGGIGNSVSKPTLASYYADLNLLNQPVSLKNNVQAKLLVEIWLGPTSQPTPTHLEIQRDFIEAFSNHGSNIRFWLSCFSLQY